MLGSEVSYAWQNINSFVKQRYFGQATPFERQKIAVLMMIVLAKRFREGLPLPSVQDISDGLMAPAPLISDLFSLLSKAGYTVLTDNVDSEVYAPARTLEDVRVVDIISVVNMDGDNRVFAEFAEKFGFLDALFSRLGEAVTASPGNMTLYECAEKYPSYVLEIVPETSPDSQE